MAHARTILAFNKQYQEMEASNPNSDGVVDRESDPVTVVTQFMERRGPEMHEAFAVESTFNPGSQQYEATEKHQYVGTFYTKPLAPH